MYNNEIKDKFVELRAAGKSFGDISQELGVVKSTLHRWEDERADDIARLRRIAWEETEAEIGFRLEEQLSGLACDIKDFQTTLDRVNRNKLSVRETLMLLRESRREYFRLRNMLMGAASRPGPRERSPQPPLRRKLHSGRTMKSQMCNLKPLPRLPCSFLPQRFPRKQNRTKQNDPTQLQKSDHVIPATYNNPFPSRSIFPAPLPHPNHLSTLNPLRWSLLPRPRAAGRSPRRIDIRFQLGLRVRDRLVLRVPPWKRRIHPKSNRYPTKKTGVRVQAFLLIVILIPTPRAKLRDATINQQTRSTLNQQLSTRLRIRPKPCHYPAKIRGILSTYHPSPNRTVPCLRDHKALLFIHHSSTKNRGTAVQLLSIHTLFWTRSLSSNQPSSAPTNVCVRFWRNACKREPPAQPENPLEVTRQLKNTEGCLAGSEPHPPHLSTAKTARSKILPHFCCKLSGFCFKSVNPTVLTSILVRGLDAQIVGCIRVEMPLER